MTNAGRAADSTDPGTRVAPTAVSGNDEPRLIVHVFDVGHGDAIAIEFPDGEAVGVIDAGGVTSARQSHPIVDWVVDRAPARTTRIVFAVLTHPHADHYSAFSDLIGALVGALVEIDHIPEQFWSVDESPEAARAFGQLVQSDIAETEEDRGRLARVYDSIAKLERERHSAWRQVRRSTPKAPFFEVGDVSIFALSPTNKMVRQYRSFIDLPDRDRRRRLTRRCALAFSDVNLLSVTLRIEWGDAAVSPWGRRTELRVGSGSTRGARMATFQRRQGGTPRIEERFTLPRSAGRPRRFHLASCGS